MAGRRAVRQEGSRLPALRQPRPHQLVMNQKPLKWACEACRGYFSVRSGNILAHTKIPLQKWAIGNYLQVSSLKGMSRMKLHRDLGIP